MRVKHIVALAAGLFGLAGNTKAASYFIGDGDGNAITATANAEETYATAISMIDGSGMSDAPVVKTSINTQSWWVGSWLTHQGTNSNYGQGWLLFTFAQNTSLEEIVIWNLLSAETNAAYGRGMKAVTITCSTGSDASGTGGATLFTGDLAQATWSTGYGYTDDLIFPEVQNVKAVKIDYTSNYGGDATGLSEIRFVGTAAVPEPSGNLALLGLCSTGLLTRRRLTRKA